jgi:hypothetical protein
MVLVEDIILAHARTPYDPVKRREYYLRTRQLKGRGPGSGSTLGGSKIPGKGEPPKSGRRDSAIDARVSELQARLIKLRVLLRKLVEDAKRRSGVEIKKDNATTNTDTTGSTNKTEPQTKTVSQKKEAAKKSKEYYDKNIKKVSLSTREKQLKDQIADAERTIMKIRTDLKASIERARKKANIDRQ